MRRRIMIVLGALLVAAGGTACQSHSAETPNLVKTQPGGPCKGKRCSSSPNSASNPASRSTGGDGQPQQ